jgi:spore maturation protein CgeB
VKLLLVGNEGGTNVGASFQRAAKAAGIEVRTCRSSDAFAGPALIRHANWRLRGRRPPRLGSFSASVVAAAQEFRPDVLLATGTAPITAEALQEIKSLGVTTANYLTDDPWNPTFRGKWLFESVRSYDWVFSPRRSNMSDLRALGCPRVQYLPFAYDPELFFPVQAQGEEHDVIFAAAADRDRIPYITALLERGYRLGLYGVFWDRFGATRGRAGEWLPPERLRPKVAAARVALCLVRRANRDGHVMRTYELAAMRACILAEDTEEQREILGATVDYFRTPADLTARLDALLADPAARAKSAAAAHARITTGGNTYADRLRTILSAVAPALAQS